MINVIIPFVEGIDKYRNLLESIEDADDIKVYLGIKHNNYDSVINEFGDAENFNFFEFDVSADKEQMINAIQDYIIDGSILILRKPISVNEFEKIVGSDRDVVTSKKNRSKFKTFIFGLWQKITKMVLGVKMYAGNYSVIYLNEDIADVALSTGNLSYSTRVNRWKGIKQGIITTAAAEEKTKKSPVVNLKYILLSLLLVVLGAAVTAVVSIFVDMTIMIGLFLFCLDAVCVAVALILITMLIFTNMVGKKQCSKAIIMNSIVKNEED